MTQKNGTTITADSRRQLTDQIIKEDLLGQTTQYHSRNVYHSDFALRPSIIISLD